MNITFIIVASAVLLGMLSLCLNRIRTGKEVSEVIQNILIILGIAFTIMLLSIGMRLILMGMGW